ncbi:MAG: TRAP transporter TatT component family protein [Proteobacteria bacterium]|nr:TRAP transporter TatT component family protein [Pseudomonadota bacterium]
MIRIKQRVKCLALVLAACLAPGCASLVSGAADDLSRAILNHDDPATVEAAAPAYLLMIDSLIGEDADDEKLLRQGAALYSAYTGLFIEDTARARRLSDRAFLYGRQAVCAYEDELCDLRNMPFAELEQMLEALDDTDDVPYLMALAQSWLVWIRAHSDDWSAIADLPRTEAILAAALRLDETFDGGSAHVYLGTLKTLRPPALGGQPEEARVHFERAIELSDGNNLGARVALAENYARLLFERELHDRVLKDVLAADPRVRGLTLMNVIAQQRAERLLASADNYF